jgi:hypothetical protein
MPGRSPDTTIATPSFVDRFRSPARPAHQVAHIHWPSPGATNCDAIIVAGPHGHQSPIEYQVYIKGFPHPYSRQLFCKPNSAQERSKSTSSGASLSGPPHVVRVTDTRPASRSASTPSSGQSLLTSGSQLRLSTNNILAEMRAQMAVDRKQQATDHCDETYRKYRMEKLPRSMISKNGTSGGARLATLFGHEALGNILVKPWETTP